MIRQNLHMHSIFDDGKDTCHDMLEACRTEGMTVAGVSLHSPLPFENDWAARETGPFLKEMAFQKKVFEGRLTVKKDAPAGSVITLVCRAECSSLERTAEMKVTVE